MNEVGKRSGRSHDEGSPKKNTVPAYLRIAAILREDIASGRHALGGKLPSETQLMIRHDVPRSVAKWAIAVLKADGLVDGRQGAGVFVRAPCRHVREPYRHPPVRGDLPYLPRSEAAEGGQVDPWTYRVAEVIAGTAIAERLAVMPGDRVLCTSKRLVSEGVAIQLITSWRPMDASARSGADDLCEGVIVRPANPDEIAALDLPARGIVLAITSTYTNQGVPTATADIVLPSDRSELIYRLPFV